MFHDIDRRRASVTAFQNTLAKDCPRAMSGPTNNSSSSDKVHKLERGICFEEAFLRRAIVSRQHMPFNIILAVSINWEHLMTSQSANQGTSRYRIPRSFRDVTSCSLRRRDSVGRAVSGSQPIRPRGFGRQQLPLRWATEPCVTGESRENHDPVSSSDIARRASRERPADRCSSTNPAILSSEPLWDAQLVTCERASPHRRRIELGVRHSRSCLIVGASDPDARCHLVGSDGDCLGSRGQSTPKGNAAHRPR